MKRTSATVISIAFFVAGPGTFVGLVPWAITRWTFRTPAPGWIVMRVLGAGMIIAGIVPTASAFAEFVKAGGTPVPLAPTDRLVVSGFNRYVRNPMYVGLITSILGQVLLFGNLRLLGYAAVAAAAPAAFVHWYEEPTLAKRFGAQYEVYRRAVPGWIPRLRPWQA
ncbi:methyltransferase family protein [Raineyella fluvialis]|uniref:Isoprenylcysteine carboxyl methyltransferase n=1 Tax=Raineyella fluvialis TaxID=2662261 RepID=A0A5Q2F7P8_9ACTN|nr:isoprenylcysteine carboxylmethyltransferase family protein [Raineyella fluvialis]QGF23020.1 isoprenylcysteine carboxyl methyltransferase [Raineyella fluvialis]